VQTRSDNDIERSICDWVTSRENRGDLPFLAISRTTLDENSLEIAAS